MKERAYSYYTGNETRIEMIVKDPDMRINHMVLAPGAKIDPHLTSSAAWILVTDGVLDLTLDDQDIHTYKQGDIAAIPADTLLALANTGTEPMRLFVIKKEAC